MLDTAVLFVLPVTEIGGADVLRLFFGIFLISWGKFARSTKAVHLRKSIPHWAPVVTKSMSGWTLILFKLDPKFCPIPRSIVRRGLRHYRQAQL